MSSQFLSQPFPKDDFSLQEQIAFYENMGRALHSENNLEAAIDAYLKVLELDSTHAIAHWQIGDIYIQQGRQAEALFHKQQAIELKPDLISAEAHNTLGINFAQQRNFDAAIASFQRAIIVNPNYADAYYNLGNVFSEQELWDAAIECYEMVLTLNPSYVSAYLNLGVVLTKQQRYTEAIACYQSALELIPEFAEAYYGLGTILFNLERFGESITCFERALQIQPNYAEAAYGLGSAFGQKKQPEQAIAMFRKAVALKPDYAEAYAGLGKALAEQWQIAEAQICYQKALSLNPTLTQAQPLYQLIEFSNAYLFSGHYQAALQQFLELEQLVYTKLNELSPEDITALYIKMLFVLPHLRDDLTANTRFCEAIGKLYSEKVIESYPISISVDNALSKPRNKNLKIGFISPHFRRHAVGWLCYDIIKELSNVTKVYLYATGQIRVDDRTHLFTQAAHKFYQPQDSSQRISAEIIKQIQQDNIEVLIDLDCATVPMNVEVIYHQPAPLCISWMGFDAPFITKHNYYLTDCHAHPLEVEPYYTEKIIRMPHSLLAVAGFISEPINRAMVRASLGISPEQVAYLCLASGRKFNDEMVAAQVKILKHVPHGVLMHKAASGNSQVIQSAYQKACDLQGVDFHRIHFLPTQFPEEKHRTTYALADVILDSYPYGGGTHTFEGLWFDLPLVTKVGQQAFAGRVGYSYLKTLGITTGITWSWEEYVECGIQLGLDTELRHAVKAQLIQSKQPDSLSPLWDAQKFAKDMYALFEKLIFTHS